MQPKTVPCPIDNSHAAAIVENPERVGEYYWHCGHCDATGPMDDED